MLGRQLIGTVINNAKVTGVYLVVERAGSTATNPRDASIVDCSAAPKTEHAKETIMHEWLSRRSSAELQPPGREVQPAVTPSGDLITSGDAFPAGSEPDCETVLAGAADDAETQSKNKSATAEDKQWRAFVINSRAVIQSVAHLSLGRRHVPVQALDSLLRSWGLTSHKQMTFAMIAGIFQLGATTLRARDGRKGSYTWAQMCPEDLLLNLWSLDVEGDPAATVSGVDFLPPTYTLKLQGKGKGVVEVRRRVVCVAAYTSPFWREVVRTYFLSNPAPRKGVKRPLGANNVFPEVGDPKKSKRSRLSLLGEEKDESVAVGDKMHASDATVVAAAAAAEGAGGAAELTRAVRRAPVAAAEAAGLAQPPNGAAVVTGAQAATTQASLPRLPCASVGSNLVPTRTLRQAWPVGGMTAVGIGELASSSQRLCVASLAKTKPSPTLPLGTPLSVLLLPTQRFTAVTEGDAHLRVVLPAPRLAEGMRMLGAANRSRPRRSGVADDADQSQSTTSLCLDAVSTADDDMHAVVRIGLEDGGSVLCSMDGLTMMSSALSLNETADNASLFLSWLAPYQASAYFFPTGLDFLVGAPCSVAEAANFLASSLSKKKADDIVWQHALLPTHGGQVASGSSLYGGFSVNVRDLLANGQQAFLSNGVLDAAIVELREMVPHGAVYVLTTGQAAAFTEVLNQRVAEDVAVKRMAEIFKAMPSMHVVRFLMLMNLRNQHWIAVEVLVPAGKVVVYDSLDGGWPDAKAFAVRRVVRFASEYASWLRERDPLWESAARWEPSFENEPTQRDGHNCGAFALAQLWCVVRGIDLRAVHCVGDHLRLAILFTILKRGIVYHSFRTQQLSV
ncbi:hypothetical protein MMPV_003896 [Pyropia vietnamensis]